MLLSEEKKNSILSLFTANKTLRMLLYQKKKKRAVVIKEFCLSYCDENGKQDVDKIKIDTSFSSRTLKQIMLKDLKTLYICQTFNYTGKV